MTRWVLMMLVSLSSMTRAMMTMWVLMMLALVSLSSMTRAEHCSVNTEDGVVVAGNFKWNSHDNT